MQSLARMADTQPLEETGGTSQGQEEGPWGWLVTRGNHRGVKMTNQMKPLLNRPYMTSKTIPKRFYRVGHYIGHIKIWVGQ